MKGIEKLTLRQTPDGVVVNVKVVAGASRDRIAGVLGGAVKITTAAAPEKGKANAAVAKTLAKALGLRSRDVRLISGLTNPRKQFLIAGASPQQVRRGLGDL